jgi:leucyl aminopeptidase
MLVTAEAKAPVEAKGDLLAVPLAQMPKGELRLPARVAALDREAGGRIAAVIESGDFRGKSGQTLCLYPDGDLGVRRVLLVGLGDESAADLDALRCVAGTAVAQAASRQAARVALLVPTLRRMKPAAVARALAEGAVLGGYRFDAYRKNHRNNDDPPGEVESLALLFERASDLREARAGVREGSILGESQNVARDLSNEPANALPPAELASRAQRIAREVGLACRVLGVPEMRKLGMGAILAVGQGSVHPPRLVVLEHRPGGRRGAGKKGKAAPVCVIGKGITFDSGGISIKPAQGMDEMKHDMSGAAAVVGILRACALLRIPMHVVGVIGAAENMPSGTAYRPGDIVTSMSGKTIEILNTDAEGRVVLADALHYARSNFEPRAMIDLATLTGACVVALGKWATGLFGNNEKLVALVREAGDATAEKAWPMPLWEDHRKAVRSEIAQLKNTSFRSGGDRGRGARPG